jgi:hypothetical protein
MEFLKYCHYSIRNWLLYRDGENMASGPDGADFCVIQ